MDTWLGNLVMGMAMRNLYWVGHLHWNRDLDVFFAHFFNNFRAFLFVTVAFHNLVIILALLLKRLHTFFFWHIHCCWQALGGNSEKFQIILGKSLSKAHLVLHCGTISVLYLTLSSM